MNFQANKLTTRVSKNLFLLLLSYFTSLTVYCQEVKIGNIYKIIVETPVQEVSILETENLSNIDLDYKEIFDAGILFRVVDKQNDKILVRTLAFNNGQKNRENENKAHHIGKEDEYGKYYLLKANNIGDRIVEPSEIITVGLLTIPFKARFEEDNRPFAFSPEFNLSSAFGIRVFQNWNYSTRLYAQFGIGISTVGLNSSNSNIENDQNIAALTLLTGAMFDYNGIQIGLYIGWDSISNNDVYQWDFHGRKWFSIGIGFGLFKFGSKGKNIQ